MPKTENKNKITISDHYFFTSDEYQYILYNCGEREKIDVKTKKPTGEIAYYENVVGYYATIDILIKGYIGHALRTKILNGELKTIDDVLKETQRLQDELNEILSKVEGI